MMALRGARDGIVTRRDYHRRGLRWRRKGLRWKVIAQQASENVDHPHGMNAAQIFDRFGVFFTCVLVKDTSLNEVRRKVGIPKGKGKSKQELIRLLKEVDNVRVIDYHMPMKVPGKLGNRSHPHICWLPPDDPAGPAALLQINGYFYELPQDFDSACSDGGVLAVEDLIARIVSCGDKESQLRQALEALNLYPHKNAKGTLFAAAHDGEDESEVEEEEEGEFNLNDESMDEEEIEDEMPFDLEDAALGAFDVYNETGVVFSTYRITDPSVVDLADVVGLSRFEGRRKYDLTRTFRESSAVEYVEKYALIPHGARGRERSTLNWLPPDHPAGPRAYMVSSGRYLPLPESFDAACMVLRLQRGTLLNHLGDAAEGNDELRETLAKLGMYPPDVALARLESSSGERDLLAEEQRTIDPKELPNPFLPLYRDLLGDVEENPERLMEVERQRQWCERIGRTEDSYLDVWSLGPSNERSMEFARAFEEAFVQYAYHDNPRPDVSLEDMITRDVAFDDSFAVPEMKRWMAENVFLADGSPLYTRDDDGNLVRTTQANASQVDAQARRERGRSLEANEPNQSDIEGDRPPWEPIRVPINYSPTDVLQTDPLTDYDLDPPQSDQAVDVTPDEDIATEAHVPKPPPEPEGPPLPAGVPFRREGYHLIRTEGWDYYIRRGEGVRLDLSSAYALERPERSSMPTESETYTGRWEDVSYLQAPVAAYREVKDQTERQEDDVSYFYDRIEFSETFPVTAFHEVHRVYLIMATKHPEYIYVEGHGYLEHEGVTDRQLDFNHVYVLDGSSPSLSKCDVHGDVDDPNAALEICPEGLFMRSYEVFKDPLGYADEVRALYDDDEEPPMFDEDFVREHEGTEEEFESPDSDYA